MNELYVILEGLCKKRNITMYRMCRELDLQQSIFTDLKSGRKKSISTTTAKKLAGFFSVTVSYILGTEEYDEEALELQQYLEELKNRQEMRMLFNLAKGASKEDVEKAVKIIEALKTTDK